MVGVSHKYASIFVHLPRHSPHAAPLACRHGPGREEDEEKVATVLVRPEAAPWRRRRAKWRLHRQEGAAAAAAAAVVEYM